MSVCILKDLYRRCYSGRYMMLAMMVATPSCVGVVTNRICTRCLQD